MACKYQSRKTSTIYLKISVSEAATDEAWICSSRRVPVSKRAKIAARMTKDILYASYIIISLHFTFYKE